MTYAQTERERAVYERRYLPRLRAALEAQGRSAADHLEANGTALSSFVSDDAVENVLVDLWARVIPTFADRTARHLVPAKAEKNLDDVPDAWLDIVREFVTDTGAALVSNIRTETLRLIRATLAVAFEEGWSMQRAAAALREEWPDVANYRAERIIRTEVIRASNYGSLEGARRTAEEYGLEVEKVWLATPDGRTRDSHAAADGQRRALDGVFDVGGFAAMYPADAALPASQSVNCRCAIAYEAAVRSWRDERNAYIQDRYKALMPKHGREVAFQLIAEDERVNLSPHTVRDIVYKEAA